MSEQREEPTVRIALGGPLRAAEDGAALLAAAQERADRTRVVEAGPTGGASGPHVCATVEGRSALFEAAGVGTVARVVDRCEAG